MKIDLVGRKQPRARDGAQRVRRLRRASPARRSRRAGSPRATGCGPQPFYLGVAFVGDRPRALRASRARDPRHHVALESTLHETLGSTPMPTPREVFWRTTLTDRNLSSVSQAGLVNNLNDGMAWGLFPLFFAAANLSSSRSARSPPSILPRGASANSSPARCRIGRAQVVDRRRHVGPGGRHRRRDRLDGFAGFAIGGVLLGIGTAMVYPTLLAAIGDVALPRGGRRRSASTGCGAISAMRSAPWWPV